MKKEKRVFILVGYFALAVLIIYIGVSFIVNGSNDNKGGDSISKVRLEGVYKISFSSDYQEPKLLEKKSTSLKTLQNDLYFLIKSINESEILGEVFNQSEDSTFSIKMDLSLQGFVNKYRLSSSNDSDQIYANELLKVLEPALLISKGGNSITYEENGFAVDESHLIKVYQRKNNFVKEYVLASEGQYEGEILYQVKDSILTRAYGERNKNTYSQGQQLSKETTKIRLERLPYKDLAFLSNYYKQSSPPYVIEETMKGDSFAEKLSRRMAENTLGDSSFDDIYDLLSQANSFNKRERTKNYIKLKAFLLLYPDKTSLFREFIENYDRLDSRFRDLATALSAVGHEEAQALLREVIESISDYKEDEAKVLLAHLGFVKKPNMTTEKFLYDISEYHNKKKLRDTALLGLGTVSRSLVSEKMIERGEKIEENLQKRVERAQGIYDQRLALSALGNSSMVSVESKDLVYKKIQDKDPQIRERAVSALRHIGTEKSIQKLLSIIQKDDEKDRVRESAAESLLYSASPIDITEELKSILYTEKNLSISKRIARVLANSAVRYPHSIDVLKEFEKECAHPDLCGFITGLTNSL